MNGSTGAKVAPADSGIATGDGARRRFALARAVAFLIGGDAGEGFLAPFRALGGGSDRVLRGLLATGFFPARTQYSAHTILNLETWMRIYVFANGLQASDRQGQFSAGGVVESLADPWVRRAVGGEDQNAGAEISNGKRSLMQATMPWSIMAAFATPLSASLVPAASNTS